MAYFGERKEYWEKVIPQIKDKLSDKCPKCGSDELYLENPYVGDEDRNEEIADHVCNQCHWYKSFSVEI